MNTHGALQGSDDNLLTQQQLQPLLSNSPSSTSSATSYSRHAFQPQDSFRTPENGNEEESENIQSIPSFHLYIVHTLCTFDERLYEFASYFFIMEVFKTTLLPMSIYGFSTTIAGILFSTTVGSIVDTTPRLTAVQSFLFTQKLTTVIGALGFWVLLTWFDPTGGAPLSQLSDSISDVGFSDSQTAAGAEITGISGLSLVQGYSLFALMVIASGILKLSALGWSISIERDWIVDLCRSNSDTLTRLNVTLKRIDLACKLVSPLVFAGLLTYLNAGYCSLIMSIWCMFSLLTEWFLVRRIWDLSPVLWQPRSHYSSPRVGSMDTSRFPKAPAIKKDQNTKPLIINRDTTSSQETQPLFSTVGSQPEQQQRRYRIQLSFLRKGILSFYEYTHHIVFLASLAYTVIYVNMMSVSGTMIGYLQYRQFTAGSIATLKGICTVAELVGTILMPVLTRYVGLTRAGAWSIWLEVVTLTPVLFSIYSDRLPVQVFIFVGMTLSRIGVWSFDLVITQIMQEYIQPSYSTASLSFSSNAGIINGWHYSLMNLFELVQFFLTMTWSDPHVYYIPCTITFVCVVIGAMVYTVHLFRIRKHLFHYRRIISSAPGSTAHASGDIIEDEITQDDEDGQTESSQTTRSSSVVHRVSGGYGNAGIVSHHTIH